MLLSLVRFEVLMAMSMKMALMIIHRPDDTGNKVLRNVGQYLRN
jgi:hypothetical protein